MNKKILLVILIVVALVASGAGVYYYFASEDKSTSLTKIELEWIEKNKQDLIDLGVSNDIPVLNYVGEGLVFDFFTDLEVNTGLEFNRISHSFTDDITNEYAFKVVKNVSDSQINVYEDKYALLTLKNEKYSSIQEIKGLKIGVLESDLAEVKQYFSLCNDCEFTTFVDATKLLEAITSVTASVDAIVAPQLLTLKNVLGGTLHNAYLINEINTNYVITLGKTEKLNDIIKKYYKKWSKENFETEFNKYLTENYFEFSGTNQNSMAAFKGKRYTYGYIENGPYDMVVNSDLYGTNKAILDKFASVADIEIVFKKYANLEELLKNFNDGNIDIFFNNTASDGYSLNAFVTNSAYNGRIAVISNTNVIENITSLKSLKGKNVSALASSNASNLMKEFGAKSKLYETLDELLNSDENLIVLDFNTYDFYHKTLLKDYKLEYIYNITTPYGFTMQNTSSNTIFNEYFNFYLKSNSQNEVIGQGTNELINKISNKALVKKLCIYGGLVLIFVATVLLTSQVNKSKKPSLSFKKTEKIKYMDMLTSLKNRNYLNDNIEKWDNSQVYPQSILIVDLNNIAYINDNYGHNAGDDEIKEAANVLIKNQVINSDIVRTNGNEFLIYLVGYEERQIELYIRKLSKELKELAHGFGAAIGYSMITDDIKTIDDAINEATLAMRKIKEENNDQKDL